MPVQPFSEPVAAVYFNNPKDLKRFSNVFKHSIGRVNWQVTTRHIDHHKNDGCSEETIFRPVSLILQQKINWTAYASLGKTPAIRKQPISNLSEQSFLALRQRVFPVSTGINRQ